MQQRKLLQESEASAVQGACTRPAEASLQSLEVTGRRKPASRGQLGPKSQVVSQDPHHQRADLLLARLTATASHSGFESPGTPSRGECEHGVSKGRLLNSTASGLADFPINSQTVSGLAFFVALRTYRDKDVAMAIALCLEAALYWECHGLSDTPKASVKDKPATEGRKESSQPWQRGRSRLGRSTASRSSLQPATRRESGRKRWFSEGMEPKEQRKRHRMQDTNVSDYMCAGMAVLLWTPQRDVGGWPKPWSLGRILRKITARQTIDVVWMRPVNGSHHPTDRIFQQTWVPWKCKPASGGPETEMKANGISMGSVHFGVMCPKNGQFSPDLQQDLAASAAKLERIAAANPRLALGASK